MALICVTIGEKVVLVVGGEWFSVVMVVVNDGCGWYWKCWWCCYMVKT